MTIQFCFFLLALFFLLTFVIFCCVIVGNDPVERFFSDREQMEYIREWRESHPKARERKK